jgi:hypothetical protein
MSLQHPIVRDVIVTATQIRVSAMLLLLIVMNEEVWTTIAYSIKHNAIRQMGGVELWILTFLILPLEVYKHGPFTPG